MNKFIVLGLILISINVKAQDTQWFIKDKRFKSGYIWNTAQVNTNQINICNFFPSCSTCSPDKGRKDYFIIFEDGTCINTRPTTNIDNYVFTGNGINLSSNKNIDYLYVTNIYQGDDPPTNVSVYNNFNSDFSSTLQFYVNSIPPPYVPFSVTHDFVPGKDVTLIIPKSYEDKCDSIGKNLHLEFDHTLFKFSNIFQGDSWTYQTLEPGLIINNQGISNISSVGTRPYHFFNFKLVPILPMGVKVGDEMDFTLKCGDETVAYVKDEIRDMHDPNYIKVECIYKQLRPWYNPWSKDRYFVKYKIQFMNDGTLPVEDVKVNFTLPSVVKANTLKVGNWSFGDKTGCGRGPCLVYTPSFPNIEFNFNKFCPHNLTADDSDPATVPDIKQYGWIEFCVEINTDPSHFNSVSLQPTNPTTNFGMNHIYSIEHYIDNCTPNPNNKADCIRPIYSSIINATCSCDCPSDFDFKKPKKGL